MDSYLNGISVYWTFHFDNLRVIKKFSEIILARIVKLEDRIYATLDFDTGKFCLEDVSEENLKKYIVDDHIMVLKIQGIREEEKEVYAEWKQWEMPINISLNKISKSIYLPVKYNVSLLAYCDGQGIMFDNVSAIWYGINKQFIKHVLNKVDINYILHQCKLLTEGVKITLGIIPIINIDSERYIVCREYYSHSLYDSAINSNKMYWHNIMLEKGNISPAIRISEDDTRKCVVNITNKDIFPNVGRDCLTAYEQHMIELAIEKAALQYITRNFSGDKKLQEALQAYINKNYPENNPFYANDIM